MKARDRHQLPHNSSRTSGIDYEWMDGEEGEAVNVAKLEAKRKDQDESKNREERRS